MGKVTGFKEYNRQVEPYRPVLERIGDYQEIFTSSHQQAQLQEQGARCMDCGVPFCQSDTGCPIDNLIPEWNDLVYQNRWQEALIRLQKTNNFPEFTGRACPAPCEGSCVLGSNSPAVTIKNIEVAIVDKGFEQGWITALPPEYRTGKKIAIVGSGPAGLAAADELNQYGHNVVVFERADRIGGLLMYGIPNMKLGKDIVNRRIALLKDEGIEFVVNADIGKSIKVSELKADFDAILLATGATKARELSIENAKASGVCLAMKYLTKSTQDLLNSSADHDDLSAKDKDVIVIGGGDTGTDCIATALRQGAKSIINFELMSKPPLERADDNPWPQWPLIYRVDYGHEEVAQVFGQDPRVYCVMTKAFVVNDSGELIGVKTVQVDSENHFLEVAGSEKVWQADLVLLSLGFVSPEHYISDEIGIKLDDRQNYQASYDDYQTTQAGIFTAGDCRRGQSLIVWAINEGRGAAEKINLYLSGDHLRWRPSH